MEDTWGAQPGDAVITKICRVRTKIVEWTKLQNQNSRDLILSSQEQLEAALSDTSPVADLILSLQSSLDKVYAE